MPAALRRGRSGSGGNGRRTEGGGTWVEGTGRFGVMRKLKSSCQRVVTVPSWQKTSFTWRGLYFVCILVPRRLLFLPTEWREVTSGGSFFGWTLEPYRYGWQSSVRINTYLPVGRLSRNLRLQCVQGQNVSRVIFPILFFLEGFSPYFSF